MHLVLVAAFLCISTAYVLRPVYLGHGSIVVSGFNGISVVVGFVLFIAVAALIGPEFGLPVIASILIHEMGSVLAYRMLGHEDARFRLVPIFNKTPTSDTLLTKDGDVFFVSIMGSAFCLGPIALAATIAVTLNPTIPAVAQSFWLFAITCGALNFVLLMPFSSLPGGRCTSTAVVNFWPTLAPAMTAFMAAAMFTASLRTSSVALMVMAGVGAHSFWRRSPSGRRAMSPDAGLIALAAYAFTIAAHFSIGRHLFEAYF